LYNLLEYNITIVIYLSLLAGQFLPRAFFTLDAEGHQSDVHPVNAHLLRRLRRQVYSASSSSSSCRWFRLRWQLLYPAGCSCFLGKVLFSNDNL